MLPPLDNNEQFLFDCLREYLDVHGCSPTIRDLESGTSARSRSKVQERLKSLRQKGYIDWQPGKPRSFRVLVCGVPVLGVIQAGLVVEHPADALEWANIPGVSYKSGFYALRVCGDSMINAHIREGDLVLLQPKPDLWSLRRDAIAVVWVEGAGATLKYIEFDGEYVFLKAANSNYSTYKVRPDQIELQGIVVGIHPHYELM